jgi:hypothetical protein
MAAKMWKPDTTERKRGIFTIVHPDGDYVIPVSARPGDQVYSRDGTYLMTVPLREVTRRRITASN